MNRLIVIAALAVACRRESPERQPLAIRALEEDAALVVWREPGQAWISLVDGSARVRWSSKLVGEPVTAMRPDLGIVLGSEHVSVQTRRHAAHGWDVQVETFSRSNGTAAVTKLGTVSSQDTYARMPGYVKDGYLHECFVTDDGDTRDPWLVTIDQRTGALVSRMQLPFEPRQRVVRENDVVLQETELDGVVVRRNLQLVRLPERGCVLGEERWHLLKEDDAFFLVDEGGTKLPLELDASSASLDQCASYGASIVALFDVTVPTGHHRELRVARRDGTLMSRFADPGRFPSRAPITKVPRFVPLFHEGGERQLSMIDLETGKVTWQLTASVDDPFLIGDHWYITTMTSDPEVAVIDGTTGHLLTAKSLSVPQGLRAPTAVSGNRYGLWLSRAGWAPASEPLAQKVDLRTLTPLPGANVTMKDATPSTFARIPRN